MCQTRRRRKSTLARKRTKGDEKQRSLAHKDSRDNQLRMTRAASTPGNDLQDDGCAEPRSAELERCRLRLMLQTASVESSERGHAKFEQAPRLSPSVSLSMAAAAPPPPSPTPPPASPAATPGSAGGSGDSRRRRSGSGTPGKRTGRGAQRRTSGPPERVTYVEYLSRAEVERGLQARRLRRRPDAARFGRTLSDSCASPCSAGRCCAARCASTRGGATRRTCLWRGWRATCCSTA